MAFLIRIFLLIARRILVTRMDTSVGKPVGSGAVVTGHGLCSPEALALAAARIERPALPTAFGLAP